MKAYITSDEVIEFLLTIPEGRLITPEDIARHFGTVELPYEPYWKREVKGVAVPYWRVVNRRGWITDEFGYYRVARRKRLKAEGFKVKHLRNDIWRILAPVWAEIT